MFGYFREFYWADDSAILPYEFLDVPSVLLNQNNNTSQIDIGHSVKLTGNGMLADKGSDLSHADFGLSAYTYASAAEWNTAGYKEITIQSNDDVISVNNFVEVNIDTDSTMGSIRVNNAKRGNISAGDYGDNIYIDAYTNNGGASNLFSVQAHGGDDAITINGVQNSQYTSVNIDAGEGNDVIDLSLLADPLTNNVIRIVDGGDDTDFLLLSGDDSVTFKNVELVRGIDNASLTVSSELLANNAAGNGFMLSDIDLSFDESIASYDINVNFRDAEEDMYLNYGLDHVLGYNQIYGPDDYYVDVNRFYELAVTTTDGNHYTLLANDWTFFDSVYYTGDVYTMKTPTAYAHDAEPTSTRLSVDEWNMAGYKNAVIDSDDDTVMVNNYVDVEINDSKAGADIFVTNAKRGDITADGRDSHVSVSVLSNNQFADNTFHINTGVGNNVIALTESENSQYTSFEINTGSGRNDVVDVSGIKEAYSSDVVRTVIAGSDECPPDDFDTLILSGHDSVQFEYFECVRGRGEASLTLTSSLLQNNGSVEYDSEYHDHQMLVVEDIDLLLDDSILSYEIEALSDSNIRVLESEGIDADGFVRVTIESEDSMYGDYVLTNDQDFTTTDFSEALT